MTAAMVPLAGWRFPAVPLPFPRLSVTIRGLFSKDRTVTPL